MLSSLEIIKHQLRQLQPVLMEILTKEKMLELELMELDKLEALKVELEEELELMELELVQYQIEEILL